MDRNNTKDRNFLACVCGEPRRRGTERGLASGVQSLSYVFLLIIDRVAPVSTSMVVSALLSVTETSIEEEGDRVAGE